MFGLGITLMAVGGLSFILPLFGRQFGLVTLLGLTGMGSAIAGIIVFIAGFLLFNSARKNEESSETASFAVQTPTAQTVQTVQTVQREFFSVDEHSLFKQQTLSPKEFGQEIARLGFTFGIAQSQEYIKRQTEAEPTNNFLKAAKDNQDFLILSFSALITASFHCYTRALLKASDTTLTMIEEGIAEKMNGTMPHLGEAAIKMHKNTTLLFSMLLEQEIREENLNATADFFGRNTSDYYKLKDSDDTIEPPEMLKQYLSGLGTRFMAVCQNEFKISIIRG